MGKMPHYYIEDSLWKPKLWQRILFHFLPKTYGIDYGMLDYAVTTCVKWRGKVYIINFRKRKDYGNL